MSNTITSQRLVASRNGGPAAEAPLSADEKASLNREVNGLAQANWRNESWHQEVADELAVELDLGFTSGLAALGNVITVRELGEGERLRLDVKRGLKVFSVAPNGYIEESQMTSEHFTAPIDYMGFRVRVDDTDAGNFADTLESLQMHGGQRFLAETWRRVLTLLQEAAPVNAANYVAATGGLTAEILNSALVGVRAATGPIGATAIQTTILGRPEAIQAIYDLNLGFDPVAAEELRQTGAVARYRGANVVPLTGYLDEEGQAYFPADEILVFNANVGEFAFLGSTVVRTWAENNYDYRVLRARRAYSGAIWFPEAMRRIKIS